MQNRKGLAGTIYGKHFENPEHNRKMQEIPIWEKPLLTVVEAAKYFQIGESNIRRLTREHKDKDFVLWKDNRVYIRRKEMESFLDTINEI